MFIWAIVDVVTLISTPINLIDGTRSSVVNPDSKQNYQASWVPQASVLNTEVAGFVLQLLTCLCVISCHVKVLQ